MNRLPGSDRAGLDRYLSSSRHRLDKRSSQVPPGSTVGKAISYTLGQWERLTVYLRDGRLRPDNNLAENAIRPFVLGRKNWLFAATPDGAHASAASIAL